MVITQIGERIAMARRERENERLAPLQKLLDQKEE